MNVFDFVVAEVSFIYAIETLDIVTPLVTEGLPVKGRCLLDRKAIGSCFVDRLGYSGGVPCDFLGYTS